MHFLSSKDHVLFRSETKAGSGRLTVGHSGHPGVSARGVGSPSRAKAKAKAGTQRKCFGGEPLQQVAPLPFGIAIWNVLILSHSFGGRLRKPKQNTIPVDYSQVKRFCQELPFG